MPQPVTLHHGECLDALRNMPDNSVDSIVTDPPYGLSNTTPDKVADTIVRWASGDREYTPKGKGFMGQAWDAFVPPPAVWDECYRVLKPGGHLAVFAGSRTQDLMGISIRLAGFDIRENLAWLYGSGFPKSMDVSKAVDAYVQTGKTNSRALRGVNDSREVIGSKLGTPGKSAGQKPTTQFNENFLESRGEDMALRSELIGKSVAEGGERRDLNITKPTTLEAEKWQGWGTALKPGHEPIILARKPFPGTVAANTLENGTGGLNIDATRIGTDENLIRKATAGGSFRFDGFATVEQLREAAERGDKTPSGRDARATLARYEKTKDESFGSAAGRWPANVVLDPDTAAALDQQSGTSKDGIATNRNRGERIASTVNYANHDGQDHGYGGQGGASRFFKVAEPDPPFMYAAKAPKKERPVHVTEDGTTVQHATVKPLSVMSWLVKLVTPPGGTVLDPFAGSGTTIEAAITNGFHVIGIEREADYLPLIQQRIDRAQARATDEDPQGTLDIAS